MKNKLSEELEELVRKKTGFCKKCWGIHKNLQKMQFQNMSRNFYLIPVVQKELNNESKK